MRKAWVGVTDQRWYEFLKARPELTEVNFWRPSGRPANFHAIPPEAPFLFKTHYPHNRLVGGGFLSRHVVLPASRAWEFFGVGNGVSSVEELLTAIARYRKRPIGPGEDPAIGCTMLRAVSFFPDGASMEAPDDFAKNIVSGKSYDLDRHGSSPVELAFERLVTQTPLFVGNTDVVWERPGPTRGNRILTVPRLGQNAFRAVIEVAYERRCAITGARILPTLQAAHIRPVEAGGQHRSDNGLLLRADVHVMFDRGYVGVHPRDQTLLVSPRLRSEFGNGEEFYARAGTPISLPAGRGDRPNPEFLTWHMDERFST